MAAPVVDGTATGIGTAVASIAMGGLTTTGANRIIVVQVSIGSTTGTTPPAVTSVTGGSLTFTRRSQIVSAAQNNLKDSLEVWWALAPSTLTSTVFTVNFASSTYDDAAALVFGVSGCNTAAPWDTNSSLPATGSGVLTPTFSGISTTSANCLLLFGVGSDRIFSQNNPPSGFTLVVGSYNGGGSRYCYEEIARKGVTSVQTNQTFTWGGVIADNFAAPDVFMFDALTADATSAVRPQVFTCT
jgi:hypothetical protein